MNIDLLTKFFMWCTLINGSLLICWSTMCLFFPDLVYRLQSRWFPISREQYDLAMYAFLGLFKVMFLVFNLTPYLALLLIE